MSFATSIRVMNLFLHETGTYNEQFRRPYQTTLTGDVLGQIKQNVGQESAITPGIFAGVANQFIMPSAAPEAQIQIPLGWSERRMRFVMMLEIQFKHGGTNYQILTGWTETPGVSIYGSLDPNMVFHVNNAMMVRNQVEQTPWGQQQQTNIVDCSHVIIDDNWSGIASPHQQNLMRPEDIFSSIGTSHLSSILDQSSSFDARTTLLNTAKKSRRSNGVVTNYISDVLANFTNAAAQPGQSMQDDLEQIVTNARTYSREQSAERDPFLQTIASFRGHEAVNDRFTINDLKQLDPNVENVTTYVKMDATQMAQTHSAGQTMNWHGSDMHTQVATILSNSVPSLMMMNLLTRVAFVSTNMDFTGQINTQFGTAAGFTAMDLTRPVENFRLRLEHELLRDISLNGQRSFAIEMRVDLVGETWIKLTLDNVTYDYVTPSFCDAMLTPIVTLNKQNNQTVASDFETILGQITDVGQHTPNAGLTFPTAGL